MSHTCGHATCSKEADHEIVTPEDGVLIWFCEDHAWGYLKGCRDRLAKTIEQRDQAVTETAQARAIASQLREVKAKEMAREVIEVLSKACVNSVVKKELEAMIDKLKKGEKP